MFLSVLLACSGDCASCHYNLNYNDMKHNIMLNCKTCHTDEKLSKLNMQESCGQDCFACHNIDKINNIKNKEHVALNNCIECHTSLKNSLKEMLNNSSLFNNNIFNKK